MAFDITAYAETAAPVRFDDLDYAAFKDRPLSQEALRCMRYMSDIESHTICYLRDLLVTPSHADPDVIVSDIGLPDGDGWEMMQRLRLPRPAYTIAMSGYGMEEDRERSLAAGFRHHLVKPMDIDKLESLLEEAARERDRH